MEPPCAEAIYIWLPYAEEQAAEYDHYTFKHCLSTFKYFPIAELEELWSEQVILMSLKFALLETFVCFPDINWVAKNTLQYTAQHY